MIGRIKGVKKLMDLKAYLQRIQYSGTPEPTLETLSAIHRAHLRTIPYENLDIHRGKEVSIEPKRIFDKLVTQHRGGWCYEMNGLLSWALREIGFDVTVLSSDVRAEMDGDGSNGDHFILKVVIDGQPYLADVGFGNGIFEPIPLEPGEYQQRFLTYRLNRYDDGRWFFENYAQPGFQFTLTPRTRAHFVQRCHEQQTLPTSGFVKSTVCVRFTEPGLLILRGALLSTVTEAGTSVETVDNLASYEQLLNNQFDLHMPDVEPLWDKVWARHQAWVKEQAGD